MYAGSRALFPARRPQPRGPASAASCFSRIAVASPPGQPDHDNVVLHRFAGDGVLVRLAHLALLWLPAIFRALRRGGNLDRTDLLSACRSGAGFRAPARSPAPSRRSRRWSRQRLQRRPRRPAPPRCREAGCAWRNAAADHRLVARMQQLGADFDHRGRHRRRQRSRRLEMADFHHQPVVGADAAALARDRGDLAGVLQRAQHAVFQHLRRGCAQAAPFRPQFARDRADRDPAAVQHPRRARTGGGELPGHAARPVGFRFASGRTRSVRRFGLPSTEQPASSSAARPLAMRCGVFCERVIWVRTRFGASRPRM